jgi:AraC-like DNA-binding protein
MSIDSKLLSWTPSMEYYKFWSLKEKFKHYEHSPKDWCLFFPEKGSLYFEIEQLQGTASLGDVVLCPPDTAFRRIVISPLSLHVMRVQFPADMTGLWERSPIGKISVQNYNRLLDNLNLLRQIGAESVTVRNELIQHYMRDIWLIMCRHWQYEGFAEASSLSPDPLMNEAYTYMESNACKPNLLVKDIAGALRMTSGQLTRRFKDAFELTPLQFITKVRMDKARQLLAETNLTIEQVSECCGYQNGFYLNRLFQKYAKTTPLQYRKSVRANPSRAGTSLPGPQ